MPLGLHFVLAGKKTVTNGFIFAMLILLFVCCIKALSSMAESLVSRAEDAGKTTALLSVEERLAQTLAQAMASVVSSFNQSTSSRTTYQEFLKVLAKNN